MKLAATAAMALLMHLGTATDLPDDKSTPMNIYLAETELNDLNEELYSIVEEEEDFDDAIDDLSQIWLKTVRQLEYY